MASLRTQHLNRDGNKERDVHIWGTVFPAEGTVKALRHECIQHAQETEKRPDWKSEAQSGWNWGHRGSREPDRGRPIERTLGFSLSVMEGHWKV